MAFHPAHPSTTAVPPDRSTPLVDTALRVNGVEHHVAVDPRTTLLDALRDRLHLTGTKKGCDHGECGACTVHADGRRVLACMTLAVMAQGHDITTIEGLAGADQLHAVQAAFIEHDALQCGFCTPGQVMSAVACIREGHAGSDAEIAEYMSGNICRCAAYPQIRAAVAAAAAALTGPAGSAGAANSARPAGSTGSAGRAPADGRTAAPALRAGRAGTGRT